MRRWFLLPFIFVLAGGLPCPAQTAGAGAPRLADRVTVEQAIQEAVERNLGLLAERYNLSVADARIVTAKLRPNPVVSAAVDYIPILGGYTLDNNAGPTEYNIRTDFTLERGGKREFRTQVAQAAKDVAKLELLNTTRQLALDVENAFVDVLQAKDDVQLARDNLQAFQGIVEVNQTRVRAGDLAKVELARTQVAALQFQNAVRQAEAKLRQAATKLQGLMGRPVPSPTFDALGELRRDATPVIMATVESDALEARPDLEALRRDQARSEAEIRSQLAQGKVDYDIGTEYHRQFYNGHGNGLGVYFSAPVQLFNRNQGEIERARQERLQAEARVRAMEASVRTEVNSAWVQYSSSLALLQSIEGDLLGQARDVRDTMEYSYRRGEASLVEFLDAQRAFNDARQSYNDARADYARSLYLIEAVSGKAVR